MKPDRPFVVVDAQAEKQAKLCKQLDHLPSDIFPDHTKNEIELVDSLEEITPESLQAVVGNLPDNFFDVGERAWGENHPIHLFSFYRIYGEDLVEKIDMSVWPSDQRDGEDRQALFYFESRISCQYQRLDGIDLTPLYVRERLEVVEADEDIGRVTCQSQHSDEEVYIHAHLPAQYLPSPRERVRNKLKVFPPEDDYKAITMAALTAGDENLAGAMLPYTEELGEELSDITRQVYNKKTDTYDIRLVGVKAQERNNGVFCFAGASSKTEASSLPFVQALTKALKECARLGDSFSQAFLRQMGYKKNLAREVHVGYLGVVPEMALPQPYQEEELIKRHLVSDSEKN